MTTPKPIDQLTPEELRVEIALGLGWKPEVRKMYAGTKNVKGWGFNTHLSLGSPDREFNSYWQVFPKWEEDANAALTLAHALAKDSWRVTIYTACALWFVCFYLDQEGREEKASAGTFALALSRAYLAVVRAGKEQQG